MNKMRLVASITFAGAALFAAQSNADVSFCLQTPTTVNMQPLTSNEVGIVIAQRQSTGSYVTKANNYYGSGAGWFWTSSLPGSVQLPPNCYVVSISAKNSPPNGSIPWQCGATVTTQSSFQTSVVGSITPPGGQQSYPVANMFILGSTFDLNTNPGNINCPPPGQ